MNGRDKVFATTREAARLLGVSQPTVAHGLQQGKFPFGVAVKNSGKGFTYIIYVAELMRFAQEKGIIKGVSAGNKI